MNVESNPELENTVVVSDLVAGQVRDGCKQELGVLPGVGWAMWVMAEVSEKAGVGLQPAVVMVVTALTPLPFAPEVRARSRLGLPQPA